VGFKISDTSFAVQAGDHGSSIMSQLAYFDLETNAWSAGKSIKIRKKTCFLIMQSNHSEWLGGSATVTACENVRVFKSNIKKGLFLWRKNGIQSRKNLCKI
jgi:hypothetical protein